MEEDDRGEWEEWQDEGDEAEELALCLFCTLKFSDADKCYSHCKVVHGFDFYDIQKREKLSFLSSMKLINYVRKNVSENKCVSCVESFNSNADLLHHLQKEGHLSFQSLEDEKPWLLDDFLTPIIESDMLLYSCELEDDDEDERPLPVGIEEQDIQGLNVKERLELLRVVAAGKILADGQEGAVVDKETEEALNSLKEVTKMEEEVSEADEEVKIDLGLSMGMETVESQMSEPEKEDEGQSRIRKRAGMKVAFGGVVEKEVQRVDSSYFGSYGAFGIHREMLSDKVRTEAYRDALTLNPGLMEGSVVMDIGCGTGILSLFAAKAGASKVVAVDASRNIVMAAEKIARENGYSAKNPPKSSGTISSPLDPKPVIHFVEGKAEELVAAESVSSSSSIGPHAVVPIEPGSADVVVSEWMGYCLLFEAMLPSVLAVRDKWLKKGGAVLPDISKMFVAGFGKGGTSLPFWENVYGFDMSSVGNQVLEDCMHLPIVDVIPPESVITRPCLLHTFDISTMTVDQCDFTSEFVLELPETAMHENKREDFSSPCYGVVVWFDVEFSSRFCKDHPVVMSTSPLEPKTHWAQTILTFEQPLYLHRGDAPSCDEISAKSTALGTFEFPARLIKGRISVARSRRHRSIDISLEVSVLAGDFIRKLPVQIFDI